MLKTTKSNDYHNNNNNNPGSSNISGESNILVHDQIFDDNNKNDCEQITCKHINFIKCNNNLVEFEEDEEEEEDYEENYTSTDQGNDDEEGEDEELDLTNLTWLTELRNQTIGFVSMALDEETKKDNETTSVSTENISIQQLSNIQFPASELPAKLTTNLLVQKKLKHTSQMAQLKPGDESRVFKIGNQPKRPTPAERYEMFLTKIRRDLEIYEESAINYQSDIVEKPPFNYSHIIGMAMMENGKRITLQEICSWIERKFAFFRVRKKWNNSIRHNLSLHPCFRKISRNKEDKGKGGYWELGVDPKKCDRKRIRNRKSSAQPTKAQKKHLQAHFSKTTKRKQQNFAIIKKLNISKNSNGNFIKSFPIENEYEELILDEMDVQQNIDVMSTNANNKFNIAATADTLFELSEIHKGLQQTEKTTEVSSNRKLGLEVSETSPSNAEQVCHHHPLGKIIVSSTNVGIDMPNLQNISAPNSFLTTTSPSKQLLEESQRTHNNIRFSVIEDVPQNENVIISSYISNFSDGFLTGNKESKSNQCQNFTCSSSPNSITLDFSAFPAQSLHSRPNVIVEQLIQPTLNFSSIEISPDCMPTSSLNPSSSTMSRTGSQNRDYSSNGLINENFRPYIDGIDEAFQYLRSIDNTRNEDILDNLLDISVSDY